MKTKAFWKSKTLWANVIAFAATVGGLFGFEVDAETQATLVAGVMAVINIVMRFVTKDAIGVSDSADSD